MIFYSNKLIWRFMMCPYLTIKNIVNKFTLKFYLYLSRVKTHNETDFLCWVVVVMCSIWSFIILFLHIWVYLLKKFVPPVKNFMQDYNIYELSWDSYIKINLRYYPYFEKFFIKLPYYLSYGLFWYFFTYALCPYFENWYFLHWDFFLSFYDSVSLSLILLTTLIIPICMYCGDRNKFYLTYIWLLLFIEIFLIFCFLTHDLLFFYISFEVVTILMFLIILNWGYAPRKSLASYYFFYFTFISSLFFLSGLVLIYLNYSTFNWYLLVESGFTEFDQKILWWLFFIAFAVKVPMFPFHVWLPEAHVEAPTGGSILLAAVLLKLGFYGMFRFNLGLFYWASNYFSVFVYVFALLSIYHAVFAALRQIDAKRIIAYSSIAHMNMALLGLFNMTLEGISGSFLFMLGHGFVAGTLFFLIGVLFNRYNTRSLLYFGGFLKYMPIFSFFFFFMILANISFPFTVSFVSEFLVLISISVKSKLLFLIVIPTTILNLVNCLFLYIRISHGVFPSNILPKFFDMLTVDFIFCFMLSLLVLIFGIAPNFILDTINIEFSFLFNDN